MQNLIQNDHLQRSCPAQHQSCSERKFAKKICAQNLQNFTEMIRNNNLQICFTEPHYEKKFQNNSLQKTFPHRQFAQKKVLDKTTTTKNKLQKSCPAEQFVNKLSGTTRISTTIISKKNTSYSSQCVFRQSKCIELFSADVQFADSAYIIWVSRYNLNMVHLVELIDHINNMTSKIL